MFARILPLIPGFQRPAPYDYSAVEDGKARSLAMLERLNVHLAPEGYLVGETLTLADVFITAFLSRAFEWVLDAEWRNNHPRTWGYCQHKFGLSSFRDAFEGARAIETETPNQNPYQ